MSGHFPAYRLLDSGNFRKLEQAGEYRLIRPALNASWTPSLAAAEWNAADAEFVREGIRAACPQLGEITVTGLGVVIGAHCGPGLLTVFYLCGGREPE